VTAATYTYDRLDRITSAVTPLGGTTYTPDANGNTVGRGTDTFAFDQLKRLKQSVVAGSTATYAYDGDGVRVGQTAGGVTTTYTHDVAAGLEVVIDDGARRYVWGPGLAYAVTTTGGAVDMVHADGLGSVRALTDATGVVTQTYEYDAYGSLTVANGSRTQPFGYTGEPRDSTGLVHLRARMYDPTIGRFMSRDSFAGLAELPLSQNRHAYVHGNPVNETDPSGHSPCSLPAPSEQDSVWRSMRASLMCQAKSSPEARCCAPLLKAVYRAPSGWAPAGLPVGLLDTVNSLLPPGERAMRGQQK
jgi:RHS repeat-associated protein